MAPITNVVNEPVLQNGFTPAQTGFPLTQSPNQFFPLCSNDVVSMLASEPSAFLKWLPAVPTTFMNRQVNHLSFVVPEDFDGTESYLDHILGNDPIGECEYGTGAVEFNICSFNQGTSRITFSNKEKPLNKFSAGGITYCQQQPRLVMRGSTAGLQIDNDRDWAVSGLLYLLQNHLRWNVWYGDESYGNSDPGMYDGLDKILTTNWVKSRATTGTCLMTDPLVINGIPLNTIEKFVKSFRFAVRYQMNRMLTRGFDPSPDDMVFVVPRVIANMMWDYIATGILSTQPVTGIDWSMTPDAWQREREKMTRGGVGFGFIPVDNREIPIIPEDMLGRNRTTIAGDPAITFDAFLLVKNFDNSPILMHEYVNLAAASDLPAGVGNHMYAQNGMLRTSWVEVNNLCYYYGLEMYGRVVSTMNTLQTRWNDVTIETNGDYPLIDAGSYVHENYYPYEGQEAWSGGAALLTPYFN